MNILDPLSLPLNQSCLIEASAGTGKTYTMANLYLRLILGVGCDPLNVEQILVVTFTKAATQELRDRIRAKLSDVAKWFENPESEEAKTGLAEPFLQKLYAEVRPNLAKALLRLRIAEQEMDLASIFTIDSFCQKMLFQYAFDSGVRFDIDLQTDESELLKQLSEETWRELFYPADLAQAAIAQKVLHSPHSALAQVKSHLSEMLPVLSPEQQQFLNADLHEETARYLPFISETKQYWREHREEIVAPIQQQFDSNSKTLNGSSYKPDFLKKWLETLDEWAENDDLTFLADPLNRFSQSFIEQKTNKNSNIIQSVHFEKIDQFITQYQNEFEQLDSLLDIQTTFRFFEALRAKLSAYKNSHIEKNFTDMILYFYHALTSEKGTVLAEKIRKQFKFAMIDESQDTNQVQYDIFNAIFMKDPHCGFILIGDPKQSIYKFRGADIYSYLNASNEVAEKFTLNKNWRSLPDIVQGVNNLFTFPKDSENSPFLSPEIQFQSVEYKKPESELLNGNKAWNIYLQPEAYNRGHLKSDLIAEQCADQICRQLNSAAQGALFIEEDREIETENGMRKQRIQRPLEAEDIAILVRSHNDATRIKKALAARNIQSVYLSEDNNVYSSQEAKDLAFILSACLNPYAPKAILTALATSSWGFDSAEIYQLKNSENMWENYVEEFIHYQHIWKSQGILPMLHQLFMQKGIISRLKTSENADRKITNLLHLSELLQAETANTENEFALLRRFVQQIENPQGNDEQILRLESEEKLIKIITIHKSKGLEYPVVWMPFIAKKSQGAASEAISFYRDENQQLRWDFNSKNKAVIDIKNNAEYAEDLRLLYVALTRAKYQLHLILPTEFSSSWNAMHYILANGNLGKTGVQSQPALLDKGFQEENSRFITLSDTTPPALKYQPATTETKSAVAKTFSSTISGSGQITSFTALQAQNERLQNFQVKRPLAGADHGLDYDQEHIATPVVNDEDLMQAFSPYHFPHSTKVGNLLHKFFELWDFRQTASDTAIATLCEQLNLDEQWIAPTQTWFECIKTTPFGGGIQLAHIAPQQRLNEWQFYLRLRNEKALPQLNRLLQNESALAKKLPDLQLKQLDGFVRGFVDMIAQIDGKFYIIDYKSNFLGYIAEDYSPQRIEKVIGQYRYDLQYLLYTLAVHRYLTSRLGENYNYERDFGGVAYLFLRGMNGEENSGVYFEKPSKTLIEQLDTLFA